MGLGDAFSDGIFWDCGMMFNVLLSCAGRRVELLRIWQRTLLELGARDMILGEVLATDAQPFAPAFILADRCEIVPRATSPAFVPRMLELCRQHEIRAVIPTIDTELLVLSEARDDFERIGTQVLVSDPETIRLSADKRLTHAWFVEHGFPTFRQCSPRDALSDSDWPYPCIAKPASGSRSVGVERIGSREALELRIRNGQSDDVVESLGHGVEVTADAYVSLKTGKCLCVVPRRRLEVRDGEVSKGKTIEAPEIEALVQRVVEALPGARGVLCVQMFWDPESREISLMEINPRFGGGYPLTDASGARFTDWIVRELSGQSVEECHAWTRNLVMLRYDKSVFIQG